MLRPLNEHEKACKGCNKAKLKTDFYTNLSCKDGLDLFCKECKLKKIAERKIEKIKNGTFNYNRERWSRVVQRARKKKILCDITLQEFSDWWNGTKEVCYYCGISIEAHLGIRELVSVYEGNNFFINRAKKCFDFARVKDFIIDRRDISMDYTVDNMIKICGLCNGLKGDYFTEEEFLLLAPYSLIKLKEAISISEKQRPFPM